MQIEFLAAARDEFLSAVSYYDAAKEGLGDEFYDEVWRTISRIVSHPRAWQMLSSRTKALYYQKVSLRGLISGKIRLNIDSRHDASAPRPSELEESRLRLWKMAPVECKAI